MSQTKSERSRGAGDAWSDGRADRGRGSPVGHDERPVDIRDLFSFQLQRLAALSTRIAVLSIRPRYGITAREWRALAVLKYLEKTTLQELAKHSGLLKSQMSRTVSTLIERGFIEKNANPEDGRSIHLKLTQRGRQLSDGILADSLARNEQMLASLSSAERHMLVELMQRVTKTSSDYYHALKREASASDLSALEED